MFHEASRFHVNSLSSWDTSRVTSMAFMFASAEHFNGELNWNVARVQHFHGMFQNADMFRGEGLAQWDVTGAIDKLPTVNQEVDSYGFVSMFDGARDFDQDISHWDMRYARKLDFMFRVRTPCRNNWFAVSCTWVCCVFCLMPKPNSYFTLVRRTLMHSIKIYHFGTLIRSLK